MNPYSQTSHNQNPTVLQQYATVSAVGATLYGGAKVAQIAGEGVNKALGYGPKPPTRYDSFLKCCSDIVTIGGAATIVSSLAYQLTKGVLDACADVYDSCTAQSAPQPTQPTKATTPNRDPGYLNSRRP